MTRVTNRAARLTAGALVLGLGGLLVGVPALAVDDRSDKKPVSGRIVERDKGDGATKVYTATKQLTRTFAEPDGSAYSFPTNTVTVNASPVTDLRSRQRVEISWTGAQPSGGRAANPYGENGLNQEYPVIVLQCRGTDDPSLPLDQQVRPETCWTNAFAERSQIDSSDSSAAWMRDLYATESQKQRVSITGDAPTPGEDVCPGLGQSGLYTHLTPFIAASGTVYPACDSKTMPPEASVNGALLAAEIAAFTDKEGNGSVEFEVRTDKENESLGCNTKTPCTIEVIPINGLSCQAQEDPPSLTDSACRKGGQFEAGSSNTGGVGLGVDQAVSWPLWWSATNWNNRIPVPVTFGLPPDTCDVLDPRAPTGFYGSELLAQASLQWSPAYCLNKKRFKYQHNVMSDDAGFSLMDSGGGPAALVSSEHRQTSDDPVGYAPTAVSGFGIGYIIDLPGNQGEYTDLKLSPRLIAKLLTQSYPGSSYGTGHPGLETNPLGIMNDPEFIQLNPGLSQISQETGAALMSLSVGSDVLEQLTSWIAADKTAMDFINGKADAWGMKVNPAYKKIKLPKDEWPLKDTYIPVTQNECRQANPSVYFNQLAAPVSTLRIIAQALLDGWPLLQTRCELDLSTGTWKTGRVDRQNYGARFMLGLVSLGDAKRYGLRTARMQTEKDTYVGADEASLAAAVDLMKVAEPKPKKNDGASAGAASDDEASDDEAARAAAAGVDKGTGKSGATPTGEPFVLDQRDVRTSKRAYPGTMVIYTAARERNLAQGDARKVADFIRISTSEGQKLGTGNGELPLGFVPISKKGVTKKLYDSAQYVADKVEAQTPAPAEPTETPSSGQSSNPSSPQGGGTTPTPDAPTDTVPSEAPSAAPSPSAAPTETATVEMPATQAVSSDLGNRVVPILLLLGLLGIALTSGVRFFVRPPKAGPGA